MSWKIYNNKTAKKKRVRSIKMSKNLQNFGKS